MELKRAQWAISRAKSYRFNRTFMELKHFALPEYDKLGYGFNRTFMELKLVKIKFAVRTFRVLIGPSWN